MSAAVRPIHLPGAAALDALRLHAQAVLDAWGCEWLQGWSDADQWTTKLHSRVVSAAATAQTGEYEALRAATGYIWFRRGATDVLNFARAVVGAELMPGGICADDWIDEVNSRAWDSRNRALCAGLLGAPVADATRTSAGELPSSLFALGSGAVELTCDALGLQVIVDSAVWRCVPAVERVPPQRRPKLTPLDRAAHKSRARLEIMLGSADVELPKLLDLRCGDVLRLSQRLDQGIAVLCEGQPLAHAALGELQGRKCVQVVANRSTPVPGTAGKIS